MGDNMVYHLDYFPLNLETESHVKNEHLLRKQV